MSEKTKQIITTVIGAVVVGVSTVLTSLGVSWSPVFIGVAGSINEALNLILEQFVKRS